MNATFLIVGNGPSPFRAQGVTRRELACAWALAIERGVVSGDNEASLAEHHDDLWISVLQGPVSEDALGADNSVITWCVIPDDSKALNDFRSGNPMRFPVGSRDSWAAVADKLAAISNKAEVDTMREAIAAAITADRKEQLRRLRAVIDGIAEGGPLDQLDDYYEELRRSVGDTEP